MTLENNKSCIEFLEEDRERLACELQIDQQERSKVKDFLEKQKALELTMGTMKVHIRELETEREKLGSKCEAQQVTIASLEEQEELKSSKVEMLEAMVRSLMENSGTNPNEPSSLPPGSRMKSSQRKWRVLLSGS